MPNPKLFGALTGEIKDYQCPRCKKSLGCFYSDNEGVMYFCGHEDCLKDDSQYSRNKDLKKPIDEKHIPELGHRYADASLSKWMANEHHIAQVFEWSKKPKNFLVVVGPPGCGKTYFCAAMTYYLKGNGFDVKYLGIRRFLEEIHKSIQDNHGQYSAIKRICQSQVLILDDLGASTNNEWQKEVLLDLIDQRYAECQPTIITSNLNFDDLKRILGERLQRRLKAPENLKITLGSYEP